MNANTAKKGFKTFIILSVASVGVFALVQAIPQGLEYITSASNEELPKNVTILEEEDNILVEWQVDKAFTGGVIFGETVRPNTTINSNKLDKNHSIKIPKNNLQPEKIYYLKIISGEKVYGKNGCLEDSPQELNNCDFYTFTIKEIPQIDYKQYRYPSN